MPRVFLVVTLCAVLAVPALAEPITFVFGGEITNIDGQLIPPFQNAQVGDPFEFSYVFESTTPDSDPDPNVGAYQAISEFRVKIGAAEGSWPTMAPFNLISVFPVTDRYGALPGFPPVAAIAVVDFEPGTIQNDALLLTLPWDKRINTSFALAAGGAADGTITTWTPEPTTLGLLALVSPFAFRRRS